MRTARRRTAVIRIVVLGALATLLTTVVALLTTTPAGAGSTPARSAPPHRSTHVGEATTPHLTVRHEPSTPHNRSSARDAVPSHRRARTLTRELGPLVDSRRTVLVLVGAAVGLAVLVFGLVVLVGRRPDPRVAASADRLRSRISG